MLGAAVLYVLLYRENRRRNLLNLDPDEADQLAFNDLTDKEILHFRYAL
jgi:hypothetical protein